jgi:thiaminase
MAAPGEIKSVRITSQIKCCLTNKEIFMTGFSERLVKETERERQSLIGVPIMRQALTGELTRYQYLEFLGQAYHHVKHTVPLLMALGSRLPETHRWLQSAVAEYIEEEVGHEEWILSDIAACGGNANLVRTAEPHLATEMMVAYAYYQIDRGNPMGFFGMVHVLEGTSVSVATQAAKAIGTSLGLPENAFSYLNSHGSLDLEHIKFFETLMDRVVMPDDQHDIIRCAKRFYRLYENIFRSLPSDGFSPPSPVGSEEVFYAD